VLQRGETQHLVEHLLPCGPGKRIECFRNLLRGGNHGFSLHLNWLGGSDLGPGFAVEIASARTRDSIKELREKELLVG
jgi:hypothetical protein